MGYIDLHSHWIAGIDDGVKTVADGVDLLRRLGRAGFTTVVATPHMRPSMFDNERKDLVAAYDRMVAELPPDVPSVGLSSEHFFDDIVHDRILRGEAVPYPGERAVLIELSTDVLPAQFPQRLFDIRRRGLVPVIAHPERYRPVWKTTDCLDPALDVGACLLLDLCALVGKYGREPQRAAERLLEEDAYEAACSDAHRPADADAVVRAIARLEQLVGAEERDRLLITGPSDILQGKIG